MLNPQITKVFKKDYKRCQKRGLKLSQLDDAMMKIMREEPLPIELKDHQLKGNWSGSRECHIEPDWLLIYTLDDESVTFERTGSHSDLFNK